MTTRSPRRFARLARRSAASPVTTWAGGHGGPYRDGCRDQRAWTLGGDTHMDIGHIISVHEGRAYGLSDAELFHDENLVAMCNGSVCEP